MNITQEFETIAAISTPIGVGGVGVIRISGSESFDIAKKLQIKIIFRQEKFATVGLLTEKQKLMKF